MLSKVELSSGSVVDVLLVAAATSLELMLLLLLLQRILSGRGESLGCVLRMYASAAADEDEDEVDDDSDGRGDVAEAAESMSVSPGSGLSERFLDGAIDDVISERDFNAVNASHIFYDCFLVGIMFCLSKITW